MSGYPTRSTVQNPTSFINRNCDISFSNITTNVGRIISTAKDMNIISQTGTSGGGSGTGPQGDIGSTGPQGSIGFQGSNGNQGSIGVQGAIGLIGPSGPQGPIGSAGIQGSIGMQGSIGLIGPSGPQGLEGSIGPTGPSAVVASFLRGSRNTFQSGISSAPTTVIFNQVDQFYSTDISLDTTTGIISLQANKMYRLIAMVPVFIGTRPSFSWFNRTTNTQIGSISAGYAGNDAALNGSMGGLSEAVITTSTGTAIDFRVVSLGGGTLQLGGNSDFSLTGSYPWFDIQVIANSSPALNGSTGAQGPQGVIGLIGATGTTGPQGATGSIGRTGPTGTFGPSMNSFTLIGTTQQTNANSFYLPAYNDIVKTDQIFGGVYQGVTLLLNAPQPTAGTNIYVAIYNNSLPNTYNIILSFQAGNLTIGFNNGGLSTFSTYVYNDKIQLYWDGTQVSVYKNGSVLTLPNGLTYQTKTDQGASYVQITNNSFPSVAVNVNNVYYYPSSIRGPTGPQGSALIGSLNYSQAFSPSVTVTTPASFPYTILSTTITTSGNPVQVFACGDANPTSAGGWGIIQLYRGNTGVGGAVQFESSAANENNPYCLQVIDTPPQGTHTYSLKANNLTTTTQFGEATGPVLSVIEIQNVRGTTGPTGPQGPAGGFIQLNQIADNVQATNTVGSNIVSSWIRPFNSYGGTLMFSTSFSVFATSVSQYAFDFLIDGVVAASSNFYFNNTAVHTTIPSLFNIENIPSGAHTGAIRIPSGITVDMNDYLHMSMIEVIGANSIGITGPKGSSYFDNTGGLIFSTGPMKLFSQIESVNPQTGALTINGGVGIGGNLSVGGQILNPFLTSYRESLFTGTSTSTLTINCQTGNNFNFVLSTNTTFQFTAIPTGCVYGMNLYLTQDAIGSKLVTWPVSVSWGQAGQPTLTTTANKTDIINLVTINGGTSWFGFLAGKEF